MVMSWIAPYSGGEERSFFYAFYDNDYHSFSVPSDKINNAGLSVDGVVINHGYERDKELLQKSKLKIEMEDEYFVKGKPTSETSVEGLYAVGDILSHEGKLHLIAGAFNDAGNAVNKAKQYCS